MARTPDPCRNLCPESVLWLAGDQMLLFEGASPSLDVGNLCPSVKVLGGGTYWEMFGP